MVHHILDRFSIITIILAITITITVKSLTIVKTRILQSESCELVRYDIHHALPNNTNSMIGRSLLTMTMMITMAVTMTDTMTVTMTTITMMTNDDIENGYDYDIKLIVIVQGRSHRRS